MKFILSLLTLVVSAFTSSCTNAQTKPIEAITWNKAIELSKQPDFLLLDVRTAGEVKKGAVPGAVVIDFFDDAFLSKAKKVIGTKKVIVFCHSGGRSSEAATKLTNAGITVMEVPEGYAKYLLKEKP